tara:strand:- start:4465 stop:4866 length:402 start_codon:yes stop_codon:yes gene_type:complete
MHPVSMQYAVHGAGRGAFTQLGPGTAESLLEGHVVTMAAHAAGAVTGGEGNGLIGEEELGPHSGRHDRAMPVLEFEAAGDPGLMRPALVAELAVGVMQTTAIAHQRAPRRMRDDFAEGRDAVLEGHGQARSAC